jgi:hypothetical protein
VDEVGGSGPPPIRPGEGKKHLTMDGPPVVVGLSAASFDWLWRLVEVKHAQHTKGQFVHPEQAAVTRDALIAFRQAAGTYEPPAPATNGKRVIKRATKAATPAPEPPPQKTKRLVRVRKTV